MHDVGSKYWFKQYKQDAVQLWRWLFDIANSVAAANTEEWARNAILEVVIGCLWALGRGITQDIVSLTSIQGYFKGNHQADLIII